jgi:hypothetical protein
MKKLFMKKLKTLLIVVIFIGCMKTEPAGGDPGYSDTRWTLATNAHKDVIIGPIWSQMVIYTPQQKYQFWYDYMDITMASRFPNEHQPTGRYYLKGNNTSISLRMAMDSVSHQFGLDTTSEYPIVIFRGVDTFGYVGKNDRRAFSITNTSPTGGRILFDGSFVATYHLLIDSSLTGRIEGDLFKFLL